MSKQETFEAWAEPDIPDWAPTISCVPNLPGSYKFEDLDFDFTDMDRLFMREMVRRKHLAVLHIHITSQSQWPKSKVIPDAAACFVNHSLINSALGSHYIEAIQSTIPGMAAEDVAKSSFILVNIDRLMELHPAAKTDLSEALRITIIHELLHFTEFVKTRKTKEEIIDALSPLVLGQSGLVNNSEAKELEDDLNREYSELREKEENIVLDRTARIIDKRKFKNLVSASLIRPEIHPAAQPEEQTYYG